MARLAAGLFLAVVLGGCGPATSSGVLAGRLREKGAVLGRRPGPPRALASRVLLGGAPGAASVPYDRLLDARGEPIDGDGMAGLIQHRGQLEALYADADRGDARAVRVVQALEERFAYYGRLSADQAISPGCLMGPEFLAGCRPNYSVSEAVEGSKAAERLWAVTVDAYDARLRELEKQRKITEAVMNAVMAGTVWKDAAGAPSVEGRLRVPKEPAPGIPEARAGITSAEAGFELAALVDESSGLSREVVEARFEEAEETAPGPRLSADVAVLERTRPSLDRPPNGVKADNVHWRAYLPYFEKRLAEMRAGSKARAGAAKPVKPPRTWESYRIIWERFIRGLKYQKEGLAKLRVDAALPSAERKALTSFKKPVIEENVGVTKGDGVFFPDGVAVETEVPPGQAPRVETFSFKSIDMRAITEREWKNQITGDRQYALDNYGGVLDIRRRSMKLRGQKLRVDKVHLIYDRTLMPQQAVGQLEDFLAGQSKDGIEIRFQ